jgi:hypothetical protein
LDATDPCASQATPLSRVPHAIVGVGAIPRLAGWRRAVLTAATPPQANTNPQIPIFTQQCCCIWLCVVVSIVIVIVIAIVVLGPIPYYQLYSVKLGRPTFLSWFLLKQPPRIEPL